MAIGNYEVVNELLKHGGDPNLKNIDQLSALDIAHQRNDGKMIAMLEKQNQPTEIVSEKQLTRKNP